MSIPTLLIKVIYTSITKNAIYFLHSYVCASTYYVYNVVSWVDISHKERNNFKMSIHCLDIDFKQLPLS